jgi:hypothetical protein
MDKKLIAAMTVYAVIAVLAAFTLDDGRMRNVVWILMAGLAVKTYVAKKAGLVDPLPREESQKESPDDERHPPRGVF